MLGSALISTIIIILIIDTIFVIITSLPLPYEVPYQYLQKSFFSYLKHDADTIYLNDQLTAGSTKTNQ